MTEKKKLQAVLAYAASLGVAIPGTSPVVKAPSAKAAKPKPVLASLNLATSLVGKPVTFESGFKARAGVLASLVSGSFNYSWVNGEKSFTFVPGEGKGTHLYLTLAGEPKHYRIDRVYNLKAA